MMVGKVRKVCGNAEYGTTIDDEGEYIKWKRGEFEKGGEGIKGEDDDIGEKGDGDKE